MLCRSIFLLGPAITGANKPPTRSTHDSEDDFCDLGDEPDYRGSMLLTKCEGDKEGKNCQQERGDSKKDTQDKSKGDDMASVVVYATCGRKDMSPLYTDRAIEEAKLTLKTFIESVEDSFDSELACDALQVLSTACMYSDKLGSLVKAINDAQRTAKENETANRKRGRDLQTENMALRELAVKTMIGASTFIVFGSCFSFGCGILLGAKCAGVQVAGPTVLFALGFLAASFK